MIASGTGVGLLRIRGLIGFAEAVVAAFVGACQGVVVVGVTGVLVGGGCETGISSLFFCDILRKHLESMRAKTWALGSRNDEILGMLCRVVSMVVVVISTSRAACSQEQALGRCGCDWMSIGRRVQRRKD